MSQPLPAIPHTPPGAVSGDAEVLIDAPLLRQLSAIGGRITGDAAAGDDVAQETWWRVRRGQTGWRGEGSFAGWLRRIASRCALDWRRRQRRDERLSAGLADLRGGAAPAAHECAAAGETAQRVEQALGQLSELQRATVVLKHFEGMSVADIAQLRGCQVGTVKATLFQAFARLRELLDEERDED